MLMETQSWDEIRAHVLERDGNRCTVSRLLGGECSDILHVHHIVPREDGGTDEDDNLGTTCAVHHPMWEALRRAILERRDGHWKRCRRHHRTRAAREACERRLNRRRQVAAV